MWIETAGFNERKYKGFLCLAIWRFSECPMPSTDQLFVASRAWTGQGRPVNCNKASPRPPTLLQCSWAGFEVRGGTQRVQQTRSERDRQLQMDDQSWLHWQLHTRSNPACHTVTNTDNRCVLDEFGNLPFPFKVWTSDEKHLFHDTQNLSNKIFLKKGKKKRRKPHNQSAQILHY